MLTFLLISLISPVPAHAQQGTVTGIVQDSKYGDSLPGANVIVEGMATGTATDFDGQYTLPLDSGTYNLIFSYIGYQSKTVRGVEVTPDEIVKLNITLSPEALEMEGEVVIEAAAVRNTEGVLLRDRQKAAAVSDAISAEFIGRSGSSTASEAMRKVTGASIVGGKYVYVRGLGDRYINTQLNGANLPSADPDRNAVPLDLFPSGLLDNIVTAKTFTPDKPGSFTGGTVDIATKSFPDALTFSLSSSMAYNTVSSLKDGFLLHQGDPVNTFGTTDLALPSVFNNRTLEIPVRSIARTDPEQAARLDQLTKSFNTPFGPNFGTTPVDQSYSLSVGNQLHFWGRPLGVIGSLSYSNKVSGYTEGTSARFLLTDPNATGLSENFMLNDQKSTSEVLAGGLVNVSYKVHPRHELGVNYMYNQSGEAVARLLTGFVDNLGRENTYETRVLGVTERNLSAFQTRGEHALGGQGRVKVGWNASFSTSTQNEPDLRFFTNHFDEQDGQRRYTITASQYAPPTRYFRDLEESNESFNLNLTMPFRQWAGLPAKFKVGGSLVNKARNFRERQFLYRYDGARFPYTGNPDELFVNHLGIDEDRSTDTRTRFGLYLLDQTQPSNNYDGDQQIAAGYVMVDMPLMNRLRMVGGVRYETTEINVISQNPEIEQGRLDEKDWLPSLGLTWEATEKMNVRAAYGRTLARPTFREMAPFSAFEFVKDFILVGNPNLTRTLINSYDLRWEWFVRPGEIYAVSAFFKDFTNPIERALTPEAQNPEVQFVNVDNGRVAGLEFEIRKRLDQLGRVFENVQAGANLTLTRSQVDIEEGELEVIRFTNPSASSTRDFLGQSAFVVNLDLGYNNPASGTSVNAFYNVFGQRLMEVSTGGTPDLFEQPRNVLDLTFAQRLPAGFKLKASAKNLLDAEYKITQTFREVEYLKQSYRLGRSFSLGVAYSIE